MPTADEVFTWTFPGAPVAIRLPLDVVASLAEATSEADCAGGVLLGRTAADGAIEVTGCHAVPEENGDLHREIVRAGERRGKTETQVLGFYRTHARGRLALDARDLEIIEGSFRGREHVFLLARADGSGPATAGFFFWDGDRIHSDHCFLEFPLDPAALPAEKRERETPPASPAARRHRRWLAVAAVGVAALAGTAGLVTWHRETAAAEPAERPGQGAAMQPPAAPANIPRPEPAVSTAQPVSAPWLPENPPRAVMQTAASQPPPVRKMAPLPVQQPAPAAVPLPAPPVIAASVNLPVHPPPAAPIPAPPQPAETAPRAAAPAALPTTSGGSDVTPAVVEARPVRQVQPVVPQNALQTLSREMVVRIRLRLDASGNVLDATPEPVAGTFARYFAGLATAAARRWKFEPAHVGAHNVPSETVVEFRFRPSRQ
ncbi:MAG TPA: hypothetical protein VFA33_24140 [Bryobacteraceae bacterium]|nr:hypothetical protein [Bryobacteraceae bacterium]